MKYMVRLNGEYPAPCMSNLGVLTGDPSSPGLWNVFLADFNIKYHPADIRLYGVTVGKLEQADDIMTATTCPCAFQAKLNDIDEYAGNNGCETQLAKCVYSIASERPKMNGDFYLGGQPIKEATQFQYVGLHFQPNSKEMFFSEQHCIKEEKARRTANMCLALDHIVGDMPVWDARTLYMAHVVQYLTAGCEVSLNVVDTKRQALERVQHRYLRRMLGLNEKSMTSSLKLESCQ
jgi:hypothetical protein